MTTNIFNYATKELTQDAFLMWLFDNYNKCDEPCVQKAALGLIEIFGINSIEKINVVRQYKKIDIKLIVDTKDKKRIAVYIEDKTTSEEHDQLTNYNKIIDGEKEEYDDVKKIYYKTFIIREEEKNRIEKADWTIVHFDKIVEFWKQFISVPNLILNNYAKHVTEIFDDLNNKERPNDNEIFTLNKWIGYFKNVLIPEICEEYSCDWENYRNHYVYLEIRPKNYGKGYPYYEIRSNECYDNKFRALIQIFELNEDIFSKKDIKEEIQKIIKDKNRDSLYTCYNYENQIGQTNFKDDIDDEKFVGIFKDTLKEFKEIFDSIISN